MLAIERCHLDVEAVVATPYAAGLAALVDDEAEMGAVVVDFGGGTTTIGVFADGQLVHADAIAVGGNHVTMDIARGLTLRALRRRAAEDLLRLVHLLAVRRPRDDRGRAGRDDGEHTEPSCPSRTSCGSSGRASRRSSNSCATG